MDRELPVPDRDELYDQLWSVVSTLQDAYPGKLGDEDMIGLVDGTLDDWMRDSLQNYGTLDDFVDWEIRMNLRDSDDRESFGSTRENLDSHIPYLGSFCATRGDFQDLEEVVGQPITTVVVGLGERLKPMGLSLHSPEMKFRSVDGLIEIHPDSLRNWLLIVHDAEFYRCVINRS